MKYMVLAVLLPIIVISVRAQTAKDYYEIGTAKAEKGNFSEAIDDLGKAIDLDTTMVDAYYNRGAAKLHLKDFEGAIEDFDRTIELNPLFTNAYYNRSAAKMYAGDIDAAFEDVNVVLQQEPGYAMAYTFRAQIHFIRNERDKGCNDLIKAVQLKDPRALKLSDQYCGNMQEPGESLMLDWPNEENWRIGSQEENEEMSMIELLRDNETFDNWTEIGTMMSIKGAMNVPVEEAMQLMFQQARQKAPEARLTFLEKDESAEHPWILFAIESPGFTEESRPESQLWYIVQGREALYTCFRALRQERIPDETREKWIKFFKSGRVVTLETLEE